MNEQDALRSSCVKKRGHKTGTIFEGYENMKKKMARKVREKLVEEITQAGFILSNIFSETY